MALRLFIALVVFAFGVGLLAVSALLFDRRANLRRWLTERRVRAAGRGPGGAVATVQEVTPLQLAAIILGSAVLGLVLILGSCAGLIVW
jgi:hypothetical protein